MTTEYLKMLTKHRKITTERKGMATENMKITTEHTAMATEHMKITTERKTMTTEHTAITFKLWEDPLEAFLLNIEIDMHTNVYPKLLFGKPLK